MPRRASCPAPPAAPGAKSQHMTLTLRRLITRKGDPASSCGKREGPLRKEGPSPGCARELRGPRCSCQLARGRAAGTGEGAHLPHPRQEVAGSGRRGPGLTQRALPHWPRSAPTAGRGTRGRAGAGPDTPPPAGALHLAAAGESLPCPALRWPLRPPPSLSPPPPPAPPLPGGGLAQAASDPRRHSSLLFFPLPVWHGHH